MSGEFEFEFEFDRMTLDPSAFPDWWQEEWTGELCLDEIQVLADTTADGPPDVAQLLTIEQVAKRLQVGRCTAQALLINEEIRSFKIGRLRRVPPEAVTEYIERSLLGRQGDCA